MWLTVPEGKAPGDNTKFFLRPFLGETIPAWKEFVKIAIDLQADGTPELG
jgi:hypothetical protein